MTTATLASPLRRLLVPAAVTAILLAILIGLGVWQLQRRTWKLGILHAIDAAEAAPPIPLPADPRQFTKVRAVGTLDPSLQAFYGADVRDLPGGSQLGAQLIEPLMRPGQDPILVVLGWVPDAHPVAVTGTAVDGYVRVPDHPGTFSATDNPAQRRFYTLDPAPIGRALGLDHVAPFTLVALGADTPGVIPQPATALPRPPNDHLNYALTWFGLGLSLLVVFASYCRKVLRR